MSSFKSLFVPYLAWYLLATCCCAVRNRLDHSAFDSKIRGFQIQNARQRKVNGDYYEFIGEIKSDSKDALKPYKPWAHIKHFKHCHYHFYLHLIQYTGSDQTTWVITRSMNFGTLHVGKWFATRTLTSREVPTAWQYTFLRPDSRTTITPLTPLPAQSQPVLLAQQNALHARASQPVHYVPPLILNDTELVVNQNDTQWESIDTPSSPLNDTLYSFSTPLASASASMDERSDDENISLDPVVTSSVMVAIVSLLLFVACCRVFECCVCARDKAFKEKDVYNLKITRDPIHVKPSPATSFTSNNDKINEFPI